MRFSTKRGPLFFSSFLLACCGTGWILGQDGTWGSQNAAMSPAEQLARLDLTLETETQRLMEVDHQLSMLMERQRTSDASRAVARQDLKKHMKLLYRMTFHRAISWAGGMDGMLTQVGRITRLERMVYHEANALRHHEREHANVSEQMAGIAAEKKRIEAMIAKSSEERAGYEYVMTHGMGDPAYAMDVMASDPEHYGVQYPEQQTQGSLVQGWGAGSGVGTSDASFGMQGVPSSDVRIIPIDGRLEINDVSNGIELVSAMEATVRCPTHARVLIATDSTVVLEHAGHVQTVFAGLSAVEVTAGQTLTPGSRLGASGGRVHVQVKQGGAPVPAREWLEL